MNTVQYQAIGRVRAEKGFAIEIDPEWRPGLLGLEGFSHLLVIWHADQGQWNPDWLTMAKPYRKAPERLGIFATRSPVRPNSICLSVAPVIRIDRENGIIECAYVDAAEGTPVLDIKPWLACCDRPATPRSPEWCRHWPANLEASGRFDWQSEFLFS